MTKNQFENELLAFINRKLLNVRNSLNTKSKLFEDGYIDSMKILDLIAFVEKKLGKQINDSEMVMKNFSSVKKISDKFFPLSSYS